MKNSTVYAVKTIICLLPLSFVFNFVWESLHAVYLYREHDIPSGQYITMMLFVSSLDSVGVLFIYSVVALTGKNFHWPRGPGLGGYALFSLLGIFLAFAIEYWAVSMQGFWSYKPLMPVIFGIGITPLMQLSVTGLAAVLITRRLVSPV